MAICSVNDCDRTVASRGWCQSHYMRWYRSGSTDAKRIPSTGHPSVKEFKDGCRCEACWDRCPHGTTGGYTNWCCRCDECRHAWNMGIRVRAYAWRAERPHVKWKAAYLRRARAFGFTPLLEEFTRDDVIERWGDGCAYCESGAFEELDHFVPICLNGPHTLGNVRPSCAKCNSEKSLNERKLSHSGRHSVH